MPLQQLSSLEDYFGNKICHWFDLETEGYTARSKIFTIGAGKALRYVNNTQLLGMLTGHNVQDFIHWMTENTLY